MIDTPVSYRSTLREAARANPEGHAPLLTIRLIEGVRYRWNRPCWHCNAAPMMMSIILPHGSLETGSVTCGICSREQAWLKPPLRMGPLAPVPATDGRKLQDHPCRDCRTTIARHRTRCRPCEQERRVRVSAAARIVVLLDDGVPRHRDDICAALDIRLDCFLQAVKRVRALGYTLTRDGQTYTLVVPS